MNYTELTFAFDCEFNDLEYIPAGTKVKVYNGYQSFKDATRIIYKGEVIAYMNYSFKELS